MRSHLAIALLVMCAPATAQNPSASPPQDGARRAGPGSIVDDTASGGQLVLPKGWAVTSLSRQGAVRATLENAGAGVRTAFVVEFLLGGSFPAGDRSADRYLDRVVGREKDAPGYRLLTRERATLAGREGVRAVAVYGAGAERGARFMSACREGFYYFMLSSTCALPDREKAAAALRVLERGLRITKTEDDVIAEMVRQSASELPVFDDATVELLLRTVMPRVDSVAAYLQESGALVERSRARLRPEELRELEALEEKSVTTLTPEETGELEALQSKALSGAGLTGEEIVRVRDLVSRSILGLPAPELARLRALCGKAVRLELGLGE